MLNRYGFIVNILKTRFVLRLSECYYWQLQLRKHIGSFSFYFFCNWYDIVADI